VREKQCVVAALSGQQGQRQLGAGPHRLHMGDEPAAKLESVKLGLIKQQSQHLFPIHFTSPSKGKRGDTSHPWRRN
jgi:hypothetical protein